MELPGPEATVRAVTEAARQEEERLEGLSTPHAVEERELSASAYAGVDATRAEQLLKRQFPEALSTLNADPARVLSDDALKRPLGEFGGEVVNPEGDHQLFESVVPVRAEDEGKLKKVDLDLQDHGGALEPENPLVDLSIGRLASEGIRVGSRDLTIKQVGASPASTAQSLDDEDAFFHEVKAGSDTDLLVAPTATGVELLNQLRSQDSPEELRFDLGLPAGASLQADGTGGATVTSQSGSNIAILPAPHAVDAQGTQVPVSIEVTGGSVAVRVPRAPGEFAYPILVDPEVQSVVDSFQWESGATGLLSFANWHWEDNFPGGFEHGPTCLPGGTCWNEKGSIVGAYLAAKPGSLPAGAFGEWYYEVPAGTTTFIPGTFPPTTTNLVLRRDNHGCAWEKTPQPHDFDGVFENHQFVGLSTDRAQFFGFDGMSLKGKGVAFGLSTGEKAVSLPCRRDAEVASATITLQDPESPTITSITGLPNPNIWLPANTPITLGITAQDPGLGVQSVALNGGGLSGKPWDQPFCSGLWDNRCPGTRTGKLSFNSNALSEGATTFSVQALDPTGKGANAQTFPAKVDLKGPLLELGGQLATVTAESGMEPRSQALGDDELSLPTYKLRATATDARSGVKEVKALLDGTAVASEARSGSCDGCSLTLNYTLALHGLQPGKHVLQILAADQAGNQLEAVRRIEFEYAPATGVKDEYVLQRFPLPDGKDHSQEEESTQPEIAVNVMNGNLVYQEQDFEMKAPGEDLELQRSYNSQQPVEKDTQWGHGWSASIAPTLYPNAGEEVKPPGGGPPQNSARIQEEEAGAEYGVKLPTVSHDSVFNPDLHASITKTIDGYALEEAGGPGLEHFDQAGRIEDALPSGVENVPVIDYLCKEHLAGGDCPAVERYPADTQLRAFAREVSIEAGSPITCQGSTLEGRTKTSGSQTSLEITGWSLDGCKQEGSECQVGVENLPVPASIHADGDGGGTLQVEETSNGQAAWSFSCARLECTMSIASTLELSGGASPSLSANEPLQIIFGGRGCPDSIEFSARYSVTTPTPLFAGLVVPWTPDPPEVSYEYSGPDLSGISVSGPEPEEDASVDLALSDGLVSAISGTEISEQSYSYQSGLLSGAASSDGETAYGWDANRRLESVELSNGTLATVNYDALGRVADVTVDPAGAEAAKTTHFAYSAEPRQTVVSGGGAPEVTYVLGEDGSILKWNYAEGPPSLQLSGGLTEFANSETPMPDKDQLLRATATSPHQIKELQVIVDDTVVATEKACEDNPQTSEHECERVEMEWVASPTDFPGGRLQLEVIAIDFLGQSVAERFFVTVPQQPGPEPEAKVPPTFSGTKQFLEEYGLDKELWNNGSRFTEFIFSLLHAWENQNEPVAQRSYEAWGVPLTADDVAEMEHREAYLGHDAPLIESWGDDAMSSTYVGYYVDHRDGGTIHVGFTQDADASVASLKQEVALMEPNRVIGYVAPPGFSLAALEQKDEAVMDAWTRNATLESLVDYVEIDSQKGAIVVGTSAPTQVSNLLSTELGSLTAIEVVMSSGGAVALTAIKGGRIKAGEGIHALRAATREEVSCTAGFGAFTIKRNPSTRARHRLQFLLTAGHCFHVGETVSKPDHPRGDNPLNYFPIGTVEFFAYPEHTHYVTDAEAIRLKNFKAPRYIYIAGDHRDRRVTEAGRIHPGDSLCFSGLATGAVKCGPAVGIRALKNEGPHGRSLDIKFSESGSPGDSGAPVWDRTTGRVVGLISHKEGGYLYAAPLVHPRGFTFEKAPGVLTILGLDLEKAR